MKLLLPILVLGTIAPLRAESLPRWQFPPGSGLDYRIEQLTTIETEDGGISTTHAGGTIEINSGKGAALLDMQLRIDESTIRGEVMKPEDLEELPPISYLAVLSTDGNLVSDSDLDPTNLQLLLDLTFPLPQQPFSIDKPFTEKFSMKGSGNLADLEGEAVYTHRGYKTIDGDKYLAFSVDCKLKNSPGLPPAPFQPDPPSTNIEARIDCLFDEKLGYFYSVKNTMDLKVSMASPQNPSYRHTLNQSQIIKVQIVPPQIKIETPKEPAEGNQ